MSSITYLKGDATYPVGEGTKIVAHVCNDIGAWGAGFVLALSKRWRAPEQYYKGHHHTAPLRLGAVHFVPVSAGIEVANMVAQRGLARPPRPAICYESLAKCLFKVASHAERSEASVHMPRIGCGLGGGDWDVVERLIQDNLSRYVDVFVYDL